MAIQVDPPVRQPYRYGLLDTAQVFEHPGHLRVYENYYFESTSCHSGTTWIINCAASFAVTFTRTATTDQFTVTVSIGVLADYEYSVNGGTFSPLTSPIVIAAAPLVTVTVREVAGLQRSVTRTDINPDSPTGTVFVFQSAQSSNPPKTVTEGITQPSAAPFFVVSGISCTLIASPDLDQKARNALENSERRLVEQHFWNNQLTTSSPALPAGATAQPLTTAVAVLEAYLRDNTGLTGYLHSDAFVAPFAAKNDLITETNPDQTKRTALWTPWVFGGGYTRNGPTGQPAPPADQAWIYATGPVVIHRGEVNVPGVAAETFNPVTNQALVIAERSYVIIPDCPIAAVLADVDA